jgi:hypothetical protein
VLPPLLTVLELIPWGQAGTRHPESQSRASGGEKLPTPEKRLPRARSCDLLMSTADAASTELEALKAIYGDDLVTLPAVWGCPSFRVRVQPVTGGAPIDNRVEAQVRFTLPKRYPSDP